MNYIKKFYKIDFDIYIVQSDCIDYIIQYTSIAVSYKRQAKWRINCNLHRNVVWPCFSRKLIVV